MTPPDVLAAGAVVLRPGREVLLVHRPRHGDWSIPKGKVDPGELLPATAVREVEEETGLRVRLVRPLPSQRYEAQGAMKTSSYWVARAVRARDAAGPARRAPDDEVDEVRWVPVDDAVRLLSHDRDRDVLAAALEARRRTQPLLVVRHALARPRSTWTEDDRRRPLVADGHRQAQALVPLLAAYDVHRVVSSSSTRCTQTVAPYAEASGRRLRTEDHLSEEDATPARVRAVVERTVERLTAKDRGGLLCSHGPVLPLVLDALGVEDPGLAKGEVLVAHLRKGTVRAIERHTTL